MLLIEQLRIFFGEHELLLFDNGHSILDNGITNGFVVLNGIRLDQRERVVVIFERGR